MFTPPKQFRPFQADKGPWLIWSYYHGCWHCRDENGAAAGYTQDVTKAGVFDERVARAYHDSGPKAYRRDVAVPAVKLRAALAHAAAEKRAEADRIDETIRLIAGRAAPEATDHE